MANFPPSAPEMSDKPPPYEAASRADFPTKEESVPLVAGRLCSLALFVFSLILIVSMSFSTQKYLALASNIDRFKIH